MRRKRRQATFNAAQAADEREQRIARRRVLGLATAAARTVRSPTPPEARQVERSRRR
jgi:hypothetical protein